MSMFHKFLGWTRNNTNLNVDFAILMKNRLQFSLGKELLKLRCKEVTIGWKSHVHILVRCLNKYITVTLQ